MMRGLGYSSVWIFSSLYYIIILHWTYLNISEVFVIGGILSAIGQLYGGVVGDRYGYRKFYAISYALIAILIGLMAFSQTIMMSGYLYSAVFTGIMFINGFQNPQASSIISMESQIQLRGFSIFRVANNIGWGVGPGLGGFLIYYFGFHSIYIFAFMTILIALFFAFTVTPLNLSEIKPRQLNFKTDNLALIILSVSGFLLFTVQAQETITLSTYSHSVFSGNFIEIGLIYMINGIMVAVSQHFIYRLIKDRNEYIPLILGNLIYTLGFFSYGLGNNLTDLSLSTVIFTVGEDLSFPTGNSLVSQISRRKNIGKNLGIYNAFISFGRAFGPLLGGFALTISTNHIIIWLIATSGGFLSTILPLMFLGKLKYYREVISKE
ncbi:MFS transporter [Caldiplasma sukawensis]